MIWHLARVRHQQSGAGFVRCGGLMVVGLTKYSIEQARRNKVLRARQVSLGVLLFHLFCSVGVLGWSVGLFMSTALGFWLWCGHWLLEDIGD